VVTPFFNTADYLEECIQSVLRQTYGNWEYVLADNCSTDGSGEIAARYAGLDHRIRFIRETEFVGQVENYNRALKYISPEGEYCKIVQADDWIFPNCLEEMVTAAKMGNNIGLISSFTLEGDDPSHGGLPLSRGPVYSGPESARTELLCRRGLFGSPTCVMYLSEIVRSRQPFFSLADPYFEDTDVCFEILKDHDFAFVPQVLTYNRRDNNGLWTRMERFHPMVLRQLMAMSRHSSDFFDAKDAERLKASAERDLYRVLGKGLLLGYGKDFFRFHALGLANLGKKLSYPRIVYQMMMILLDMTLNPKRSIETIVRRLRTRRAGPDGESTDRPAR